MPSSIPDLIPTLCHLIMKQQPKSVLDLGIGHGKWGFLAREYTDAWRSRITIDNPQQTIIHGVEGCADYIGELQKAIYDKIFIGDILHLLPTMETYDLIIMTAVLEHFTKNEGHRVLEMIKEKGTVGLITVPNIVDVTGKSMNNTPYETHKSEWSLDELGQYGNAEQISSNFFLKITT